MILEAIYEPIFTENSHGFRPKRSCHTALKQIEGGFKSTSWDEKFISLISKALRVGYGEIGRISEHNIIGTPQGSVLSQILCNIYLHELDVHMLTIKKKYDKGNRATRNLEYHRISTALRRAILKQNNAKVEPLTKQLAKVKHTQTNSDSVKRLYYCRYADDWIIGIRGTKRETEEIKTSVETYLREVLQLELSPTKTKITCLTKKKVLFLGANIVRSHHKRIMKCMRLVRDPKRGLTKKSIKQRVECTLRLEAPIARIRTKLRNAGFMSKGRPDPKKVWTVLEHKQIIDLYNAVFRGYINYYKFAANYGKMVSFLRWVLFFSCARTLAARHGSNVAKVIKKYGKDLGGLIKPSYKSVHGSDRFGKIVKTNIRSMFAKTKSIARLDNLACSQCKSTYKVEMHHVRHMKDLNPKARTIDKLMAAANRKQLPLCKKCYMELHRGRKI
ncbi:hypothetical protein ACTFIY_002739 [Dictyostelium cf. discoideum]